MTFLGPAVRTFLCCLTCSAFRAVPRGHQGGLTPAPLCLLPSPPSSVSELTAHTPSGVLTPRTRPAPGRRCQGTGHSHPEDVRATGTSAIIEADPGFAQAPAPTIGEPWHLRHENQSPPTLSLRTEEDKNPSPEQGRETFVPAQRLDIPGTSRRSLQR